LTAVGRPRVRGRVRGARGDKNEVKSAETFCITAFFCPDRFRLALLGGPRLTCGSSVRGGYVLRWVRIVLKCFCLYSIDYIKIIIYAIQVGMVQIKHSSKPHILASTFDDFNRSYTIQAQLKILSMHGLYFSFQL
jgi:hypothetical protein